MSKTLSIRLRTLTPLWTGGVDGTMDRIHETGILGSLRWWYEAIVRGLGGEACDPTGENKCQYDAKDSRPPKAQLCPACYVFGTTGWRRRFRLEVRPLKGEIDLTEGMFPSGRVHPAKGQKYRTGGWMLRGGYFGTLELRFTGKEQRVLLCEILPTLLFIEQWGALGPKTSIGYGVIEITDLQIRGRTYSRTQGDWRTQLSELVTQNCQGSRIGRWWWSQELPPSSPYQGVWPALTNMFFGKVRFEVEDLKWWNDFREIQWLQSESISENGVHWTGKSNEKPKGSLKIPKPLPVSRIEHWVRCHNTFPLSPIVRTRLRYGDPSTGVCNGSNGESDWCKFVFGTVHGDEPICGYCGTKVRKDRNNQNRWWCSNGRASLACHEVFDGKRIQSRVRVSWAYRISDNKWEFRLWGWLPKHGQSDKHQQQREEFLSKLEAIIDSQPILKIHPCCFIAQGKNFTEPLAGLLNECKCEG